MRKYLVALSLLFSLNAFANQAKGRVCWSVLAAVDTQKCKVVDLPMKLQPNIKALCDSEFKENPEDKKACLAYTANKRYSPEELKDCNRWFVNTLNCLEESGTPITR